jgi:hypothetical protein
VSALALEPRILRARDGERTGADDQQLQLAPAGAQCGPAELGGEPTLDAVLAGVWEGLAAHQPAACPVCRGEMTPDYGVHALPVGGTCDRCGTRLS